MSEEQDNKQFVSESKINPVGVIIYDDEKDAYIGCIGNYRITEYCESPDEVEIEFSSAKCIYRSLFVILEINNKINAKNLKK